jgi:alpha-L-fucosidase
MNSKKMSRRDLLVHSATAMAAGSALSLSSLAATPPQQPAAPAATPPAPAAQPTPQDANRAQRMAWWHAAKFGMFIHWGVYSTFGRHEWEMENEAVPIGEYMANAAIFKPKPNAPREFARIARETGMKYMVMTSKHHEGFCNFDSKLTDYCAPKQGPGRDLVREYLEAGRAEGLRVGLYYSLMDWHHPDGALAATNDDARKRFVEYTHGLIREIMTNYGKIDVLWYDVSWPLDPVAWESEKMNKMVFDLQPDIIVNNRNKLDGDFSTPEQMIKAETGGRAWESCMTLNDSWGYQRADDNWKSAKTVIRNLISCVRDGGNYLLNIGPRLDGSIPEDSVHILGEVGQWMKRNGDTVIQSDLCQPRTSTYASFTRKGNTLYMHVHFWPGDYVAISGLQNQVKSAHLYATGQSVNFQQDKFQVKLTGLPASAPDYPITTIAIECDGEPQQDTLFVRKNKPRAGV